MMRVAILLGSAQAMKLGTGNALEGMVKMLQGLESASKEETKILEKECAEDITTLGLERDSLRADLNRYIGADNVPEKNGQTRVCTGCGGQYRAHEDARIVCQNEYTQQGTKANAAREEMNRHKYNNANPSPIQCNDYGTTAPGDADISECATEWRIDFKTDQKAEVAKQCKKTNEIMEIAINIYKSKGLGASFLQVAAVSGIKQEALEFLQSHTETERNAELLKLLHDFWQQVKRDCHQDLSDLNADINALNLHLRSKKNSAESEKKAYETATQRQHEADKCRTQEASNRDSVHEKAYLTYESFSVICPPKQEPIQASYQCNADAPADFVCEWISQSDRIHEDCQGSLMWKHGYCTKMKNEMEAYQQALAQGIETLQMIINGPSSFIQTGSEEKPAGEAMVQTEAVDFSALVSAISKAMENEIAKLNQDSSDVNQFAASCEAALTPLDLPAGQEIGGCTVNNGSPCADADPQPETCSVCLQENQCDEIKDSAIVAANNEATKQNTEDAARTAYEDAQAAYATAARKRSEKRAEWSRKKAKYEQDSAGMAQAQADLQSFANNNAGNSNAEAMNNLLGTLNAAIADMDSEWNTVNDAETAEKDTWDNGAADNPGSKAFWDAQVNMDCSDANNQRDLSHYCDIETAVSEKIVFAAQKSQFQTLLFNDCTRTMSTLNKMKEALSARKLQCKIGVTKDLKEELHKMTEALQILQQAKSKIAGTA